MSESSSSSHISTESVVIPNPEVLTDAVELDLCDSIKKYFVEYYDQTRKQKRRKCIIAGKDGINLCGHKNYSYSSGNQALEHHLGRWHRIEFEAYMKKKTARIAKNPKKRTSADWELCWKPA